MKRLVRKKVLFQCRVCRTKHASRRRAAACESKGRERRVFRKGDRVQAREPRFCLDQSQYVMSGTVIRVIGPLPPDEEYELKWLGGRRERLGQHVYQYEIWYKCPVCGRSKTARYYAPELESV